MRYGPSGPIGSIIADLSGQDDEVTSIASPFPLNFFGQVYGGLCITTNGGVYPVATAGDPCSDDYDLDVENLALSSGAPMIAVLAADLDLTECADNAPDGWGTPCEMYFGTTTVNGRDAFVLTWYRVSMNDSDNDATLSGTFQMVIVKRATGSDAAGWDFDIEYNYATLTDTEDGYSGADPTSDCDASSDVTDCRWGIGWTDYDVDTSSADPYELCATTPIADLVDGSATSLVSNSLNSTVLGRYTFSMIGGVTRGFVAPTMGSGASTSPDFVPSAPVVVGPGNLAATGPDSVPILSEPLRVCRGLVRALDSWLSWPWLP